MSESMCHGQGVWTGVLERTNCQRHYKAHAHREAKRLARMLGSLDCLHRKSKDSPYVQQGQLKHVSE